MSQHNSPSSQLSPLKQAYLAVEKMQAKLRAIEHARREPIAIIGAGCRFPGDVNNLAGYWQLLKQGNDAITEIPADRWDINVFYDPDPDTPGKISTRYGGFLGQIDRFDPQFFGIAPREAISLDPQQRLLLEVCWEALEHAGQAPDRLSGSRTGVFIGIINNDYRQLKLETGSLEDIDTYYSSGIAQSMAAGRISYVLGLQGPSLSIDTACSSSLVSVHLACQSLRNGESDMALAGGVNLILVPELSVAFSKYRMLAADGRCKAFDARADGFVRGEGCGLVVLKRLSDAIAHNDNILALILGTAVNQDGPSSGLTAPNGPAQEAVIREALDKAGVEPAAVSYVEAHGTGTSLGDPIEVQALSAVLGQGRPPATPLMIGSVKTNVGHLEGAAGIAGLIKTALALHHCQIPSHLHLETPNPLVPWEEMPVTIPTWLTPWPARAPRIAGVSAFGFSGTNAHVILGAAPEQPPVTNPADRPQHILCLSARQPDSLKQLARRFVDYLSTTADETLPDICFTANVGRAQLSYRLAVSGESTTQISDKLDAFVSSGQKERFPAGISYGVMRSADPPRAAFLFTGQGAQYINMGRQLYDTQPTFRQTIDRCAEILEPYLDRPLLSLLYPRPDSDETVINETVYTQPALFAVEYALAEMWQSWGIQPAVVMGHSVGEVVAACVAGVFSLEDGLKLIASRGRLMQALPPGGEMVAVLADQARVQAAVEPYKHQVAIAAINGPQNTVISGAGPAVQTIVKVLEAEGLKTHRLTVSHAFHSPLMEPMLADFGKIAAEVRYSPPQIKLVSNVTGQMAESSSITQAEYWQHHVRKPVQFAAAIQTVRAYGVDLFIEIGPAPILLGMGQRCLPEGAVGSLWLPSLRPGRPDWPQLLQSLGEAYVAGVTVNWSGFERDYVEARRRLRLPTTPFTRKRYWPEGKPCQQASSGISVLHPLLDRQLSSPLRETQFETQLRADSLPFLNDHRVRGICLMPGAAYVEMALASAAATFGWETVLVEDLVIHQPLIVAEEDWQTVQIIMKPDENETATFQVFSRNQAQTTVKTPWSLHAAGRVAVQPVGQGRTEVEALAAIKTRCSEAVPAAAHYQALHKRGLEFGPSLRGVEQIWRQPQGGEALGQIRLPEMLAADIQRYKLHPALLDACWQVLNAALPGDDQSNVFMPVSLDRLLFYDRPGDRVWSHVRLEPHDTHTAPETLAATVCLLAENGRTLVEIVGLRLKRASQAALQRLGQSTFEDWLYRISWQSQPLPAPDSPVLPDERWLSPAKIVTHLQPQIRDFYRKTVLQRYQDLSPHLNALCSRYILFAFQQLGWSPTPEVTFTTAELLQTLNVLPRYCSLLDRLLEILREDGLLQREESGWRVEVEMRPIDAESLNVDWNKLSATYPDFTAELGLTGCCGPRLAEVLTGAVDPLQMLFPDSSTSLAEQLYQQSPLAQAYNDMVQASVAGALRQLPEDGTLRVLEIGAGTGGTTASVLPLLSPETTDYLFTDVSPLFVARAAEKFRDYSFVRYQPLNIEQNPLTQGLKSDQFDLVVAANVIHATADLHQTLQYVQQLLKPGGLLLLLEVTRPERWIDLTFGLTEGWWKFSDTDLRPAYPLLDRSGWQRLLKTTGFSEVVAVPEAASTKTFDQAVVLAGGTKKSIASENWLVFVDDSELAGQFVNSLRNQGSRCVQVSPGTGYEVVGPDHIRIDPAARGDYRRLVREAAGAQPWNGVIYLWSLAAPPVEALEIVTLRASQQLVCGGALFLAQALVMLDKTTVPRLWLVTRGAQPVETMPAGLAAAQSSLWGLGKVIALEHPELRCTRIDLSPAGQDDEVHRLVSEIQAVTNEDQVALRQDKRYVARLSRLANGQDRPFTVTGPLKLEAAIPGMLDSLVFRSTSRRQPGPGEVEIRVHATGLNFKDVLNVLGMYPGEAGPLGSECAGEIVAVGPDVAGLEPGDAVMAVAPGSFSTYLTAPANLIVRKPEHLSDEEAASMLIPLLTAYFTLHHLGQMTARERVLIHAAAGGVGLAALQLAHQAGLEIFGTAGSPEKRAFLKSLGVQHVFDSRTLDFATEIMEITGGQGVDLVLNSLADEFASKSLSVLATGGRFLEIGKRGILSETEVKQLRPDVSYFVVDWGETNRQNPGLMRRLLLEVMAGIEAGEFKPLPQRVFVARDVTNAFRYMAQAKHIGKIVVTQPHKPHDQNPTIRLRPAATYLISGGLGGLGLLVARWLVDKGARQLVLVGRRQPTDVARKTIRAMEQLGAAVMVIQADIARLDQVAAALAKIKASLPPLRGIIHAAGVLDDAVLLHQDWARFARVLAPKVEGSWCLHTLTEHDSLDFFVLFSSIASLIGSPGQANHAAANAFMDALAHHRRALGLPGLSLNWGAWSGVGAVVEHNVAGRVADLGLGMISPEEGVQVLEQLLGQSSPQIGVTPIEWPTFLQQSGSGQQSPFYNEIVRGLRSKSSPMEPAQVRQRDLIGELQAAPPKQRSKIMLGYVRDQAGKVLGLESRTVEEHMPLRELGLDSLMAVELRNLLSSGLGLGRLLPATLVFDYPTIEAMTDYLLREMDLLKPDDQTQQGAFHSAGVLTEMNRHRALETIEELSDEEVDRLFAQQMGGIIDKDDMDG